MTASAIAAVETSLRRRFRVVETDVVVNDRKLSLLHPASAEDLIDEQAFEHDERLPYWAELWPSSQIMAREVLEMIGDHRSLLELGCGSGLVATCASLAGFRVVASDYYEDAVRFARVNAERNGGAPIQGLMLDWRYLPGRLPRFDVVIASDVLYERPYGALVAKVMGRTLSDNGVALIADPGRVGREEFVNALEPLGLHVAAKTAHRFAEGKVRQTITVFEVRRRAAAGVGASS